LGQLLADLLGIRLGLVDLVDRDHDRHVGRLGVVERLDGLGHHAVIGRDHQDRDVGDVGTTGTHGGERLVTRGVDEGQRAVLVLVLDLDLIGTDVLGDAAGLACTDGRLADGVQQTGLAVVDVAHDGDDRRPRGAVLIALLGQLGIEVDVELLEQLALLVLRGDDLDLVAELGAQQLEGVLVERLGGRGHLAHREQHGDQRRGVDVDAVGEVAQRRAAAQADLGGAVTARDRDAARRGRLHLLEFLALGTLRLARAGGLATTTECTLGAAATTATAGTATGTDGTAATGTAAGTPATATTAAASAGTSVGQATVGVLTHDAGRGHPGTGTAAGARSALAGRGTTALLRAAGAGTLAGTGHALRAGEGIVAWTRPAGAGGSATAAAGLGALAGTRHVLRAGEGIVAGARSSRTGRGTLTTGLGRHRALTAGLGGHGALTAGLRGRSGLGGLRRLGRLRRGGGLRGRLGLRGGRLGLRTLGGRLRGGLASWLGRRLGTWLGGAGGLGAALGGGLAGLDGQLLAQLAGDGGFDGRGSRANEFAHVLQLLQNDLTGVSELLGELVNADLSHNSPVSVRPTRGRGPLIPEGAHVRVLIGCPWVLLPVPLIGGVGGPEVPDELPGVDDTSEGPREAASPQGEVET